MQEIVWSPRRPCDAESFSLSKRQLDDLRQQLKERCREATKPIVTMVTKAREARTAGPLFTSPPQSARASRRFTPGRSDSLAWEFLSCAGSGSSRKKTTNSNVLWPTSRSQTDAPGRRLKKALKPARRRKLVDELMAAYGISVRRSCRLVAMNRSTRYYLMSQAQ